MENLITYSYNYGNHESLDQYLEPNKAFITSGLYLHGELQDIIGYDIALVQIDKDLKEFNGKTDEEYFKAINNAIKEQIGLGIHNILVKANGEEYQAIAYVYQDRLHPERIKGLIVLPNDTESVEYAEEVYNEEPYDL
jgi:phosphatidate phosphatase APP1